MVDVQFSSGELTLAGQLHLPDPARFSPPYPGVVICHGMGSRKENQAPFGAYMAQHGLAALCFDFRGHGASQGVVDDHTRDDVTAALDWLSARAELDPARLGLRGSSMGGMFALHTALREPRIRAVAAIAPATESLIADGIEARHLLHALDREHMPVSVDVPAFVRYLRQRDLRAEVGTLAPRALLLIHCTKDEVIPYASTLELYQAAREPKQLVSVENGHHRWAQQDVGVHQSTLEWFQKYL